MRNPFMAKNWTIGKFFLVLWIIFSVIFVSVTLWTSMVRRTYDYGVQQGLQVAVSSIMKEVTSKCEAVPLTLGDKQVSIVNVACLQNPNAENKPKHQ